MRSTILCFSLILFFQTASVWAQQKNSKAPVKKGQSKKVAKKVGKKVNDKLPAVKPMPEMVVPDNALIEKEVQQLKGLDEQLKKENAGKKKEVVRGIVDLHSHIHSHLPYGFMLFGGDPELPADPELTYKHPFKQHMNLDLLKKSGISIYMSATLINVFAFTESQARKQVLEQMEYLEKMVARHSKDFALAKTPEEARQAIQEGKIVFIHCFEGADYLIDTPAEAKEWAKRGVAMAGPIHLVDNVYGDASVMSSFRAILNWKGWLKRTFIPSWREGLSDEGKIAVENLLKAGIIVDTAHMSEKSFDQTVTMAKGQGLGVVMSHGFARHVREEERGLTDEQIRELYLNGGMGAVTGGGNMIHPHNNQSVPIRYPADYCRDSIDDYLMHVRYFEGRLGINAFPLGLGTDFNGFVPGHKPRFGDLGCFENGGVTAFDKEGLAGPHRIPDMLAYLKTQAVGVEAYYQSAEHFLSMWEKARKYAESFNQLPQK